MTLYLVKLDVEHMDTKGEPRLLGVVGFITQKPGGYRFVPQVCGHVSSRKLWPDAISCIPQWTKKCGFTRLYNRSELDAAYAARA